MNSYTTHCPVAADTSRNADIFNMPSQIDVAFSELLEELLNHGSVNIGRTEYHVMELYQYGDEEDLRNLVFMTIRDPAAAKDFATQIITDCAIYYFGDPSRGLAAQYYQENHGEY